MFSSTFELINLAGAATTSFFAFCFCNVIIVILLVGSSKPEPEFDKNMTLTVSMSTSVVVEENKDVDSNSGICQRKSSAADCSSSDNKGNLVTEVEEETALVDIVEMVGNDERENENEDDADDELRRRVEEFIEKVNRGWREEKLKNV